MADLLTLDDISDIRAYERERDEFRANVIAMKKKRRIHVGNIVTFLFENRDTMRLQIQEMARAEKIVSDEHIKQELDIYNELIPETHQLKSTMLIELVSEDELKQWLPKLPGIQNYIHLDFDGMKVQAFEPGEDRLTREEEITTTVHYINFPFTDEQRESFMSSAKDATLVIDHPEYQFSAALSDDNVAQLRQDLS